MFQPYFGFRSFNVDGIKQIYLNGNPGIKFERINKPQPAPVNPQTARSQVISKTINVIEMPNGDRIFVFLMPKDSPDFGDLPTDLKFIIQAYAQG